MPLVYDDISFNTVTGMFTIAIIETNKNGRDNFISFFLQNRNKGMHDKIKKMSESSLIGERSPDMTKLLLTPSKP